MQWSELLGHCDAGRWQAIDHALRGVLRDAPDDAQACAMAAHANLRRGNAAVARWFVHKAQGLAADMAAAQIEDACIDFYQADFGLAQRKLHPDLLDAAPQHHPVHRVRDYLACLFGGDYEPRAMDAVEQVQRYLQQGDLFSACLAARQAELFAPGEADSFAALGLFNLRAGFYRNADGNFHEAVFRQTRHRGLVDLNHFYLFCRQQRYADAIALGLAVERAGNLDAHGQGLLLEMLLRHGVPAEEIERRIAQLEPHLQARREASPVVESVKFRLALARGTVTREQLLAQLAPRLTGEDCPAAYLYLYAQLLASSRPAEAKAAAARALAADPLHPDAAQWDDAQAGGLNFEYAGLFIPREHEGGAWPTPTQTELLTLLFATPPAQQAAAWEAFAAHHSLYTLEAGSYRLLPQIYKQLAAQEVTGRDLLKGIWKKAYVENALKMKHALAVVRRLEEAQVEAVLLKGLANALPLYGDLGCRPMSDVDVLVRAEAMEKVHALMLADGWSAEGAPMADRHRFAYAVTYRHPQGGMLDIHWRPCELLSGDAYEAADFGPFETLEFMGQPWKILPPTANLLVTILHGVEWNHLSPVRWVADALLILRRHGARIDWVQLHQLAVKYHALPVLAMGLQFLQSFEPLPPLPGPLQDALATDYREDTLMKIRLRPRNVIATFEEAWVVLEHLRRRFAFGENDYLFFCGGDDPLVFQRECRRHGVRWVSHLNPHAMLAALASDSPHFNMIAIDANLSCTFHCLNVRMKGRNQSFLNHNTLACAD